MPRHTRNFFYGSHGLVVELQQGAQWFWEGAKDEHGTTSSDFSQPPNLITMAHIRNHLKCGQLTRVSVLPTAVVNAALKQS